MTAGFERKTKIIPNAALKSARATKSYQHALIFVHKVNQHVKRNEGDTLRRTGGELPSIELIHRAC